MKITIFFIIFVIFVGLCGSILRKKLYKKLLALSLSFNALIVFAGIMANANNNNDLRVFCLGAILIIGPIIGTIFYICHESEKQRDL